MCLKILIICHDELKMAGNNPSIDKTTTCHTKVSWISGDPSRCKACAYVYQWASWGEKERLTHWFGIIEETIVKETNQGSLRVLCGVLFIKCWVRLPHFPAFPSPVQHRAWCVNYVVFIAAATLRLSIWLSRNTSLIISNGV